MPCLRRPRPTAAAGRATVVAVCAMLAAAPAQAQSPATFAAAFDNDAPKPSRFQPYDPQQRNAQLGPPPVFAPASGAGVSGFDSSNARKRNAQAKGKAKAAPRPLAPAIAAPLPLSGYRKPPPASAQAAYATEPPGTPRCSSVRSIRRAASAKRQATSTRTIRSASMPAVSCSTRRSI